MEAAIGRLGLRRDGPVFGSPSGLACSVLVDALPAFLKVTNEPEELDGARALEKWDGNGAVRVLAHSGAAMVFERAGNTVNSAVTDDAVATQVLCSTADRLHAASPENLEAFPGLRSWFSSLFADTTPRFDQVREIAAELLDRPARQVLLHGDLHHENVLEAPDGRGWLAIDPKGLVGERIFDYCNIFTNWAPKQAIEHFDARLHLVGDAAGIERHDLLRWIAAWSALSGIWHLEDGHAGLASFPHAITALVLDRLGTGGSAR